MENLSEKTKGELFLFSSVIFWAILPVAIVLSYSQVSGFVSLFWSVVFAMLFFSILTFYKKSFHYLKNKIFWKYSFYIAFLNGFIFYAFFFLGLEKTSPGNVALIGSLEVLTSFLFFNVFKGEHISLEHKAGALLMLLGAFIILSKNFTTFNLGDFFILIAVCVGPLGNYFQQKVRKIASAETLLLGRNIISIPLVMVLIIIFNKSIFFTPDTRTILLLIFNGVLIFGVSRIFWIEAIHRISVTKAISLGSVSPLFTMFFAWILLNQAPTILQISSFIPLFIGILLLTDNLKLKTYTPLH